MTSPAHATEPTEAALVSHSAPSARPTERVVTPFAFLSTPVTEPSVAHPVFPFRTEVPFPISARPCVKHPSTDLVSTRTRNRTAAAAGISRPPTDYGFGRDTTPRFQTVPRQRRHRRPTYNAADKTAPTREKTTALPAAPLPSTSLQATTAAKPNHAPAPNANAPDHDSTVPPTLFRPPPGPAMGTHSPPPAVVPRPRPPPHETTAELHFRTSVARFRHSDWVREQRAEPCSNAAIRFLSMGSPSPFPPDLSIHLPPSQRPDPSDVKILAAKGRLHTDDDGLVLLVHNPPNPSRDHPIRVYAAL